MKTRIADENTAAADLLPPNAPDSSDVGVNHVDAFIKPLNTELKDGTKIACKRKGLRVTFNIGEKTGDAIMDKFANGPNPRTILVVALEAAAIAAGSSFTVEDGGLYLEV